MPFTALFEAVFNILRGSEDIWQAEVVDKLLLNPASERPFVYPEKPQSLLPTEGFFKLQPAMTQEYIKVRKTLLWRERGSTLKIALSCRGCGRFLQQLVAVVLSKPRENRYASSHRSPPSHLAQSATSQALYTCSRRE